MLYMPPADDIGYLRTKKYETSVVVEAYTINLIWCGSRCWWMGVRRVSGSYGIDCRIG